MYTEGIRKMFSNNSYFSSVEELLVAAVKAQYKAATANGKVYVYHTSMGCWVETPFNLEDFKVKL